MLLSACSSMHAFVHMLLSLEKYIIRYQIIKQIIYSLVTIPCTLKKSNFIIFFKIDCSSLHSPIFMPLTLLVVPFCWHAPVSMLQYACSRPHDTVLRQIYYPLTNNKTNNYANWKKLNLNFFQNRLIQYACSLMHAPICVLPNACFCSYKNMPSFNSSKSK